MRIQLRFLIVCILCALLSATVAAAPLRPTHAPHAIVASVHELASRAGVEMLRSGGNAVDAAVATGFALAVVHPQAGNLGGGGFMLFRNAEGKTHFIDFREKAPAAATENMYLDAQGNVIKDASIVGYKSVGVPGTVAGLVYAEKQYGNLSIEKVIAPAIKLARDGFPLAYEDTQDLKEDKYLAEFPESKRIFLRNGNYYQPGELFKQPDLAHTLERLAKDPDTFYHGAMARELAAAIHKGGGLITAEDLAAYEVKEREPIRGSYRGYDIIGAPPPSSGGVALVEILNILEGFDLAKLGNRSADAIHLEAEAFRRAFYDRTDFLGDPDFAKVPVAQLIDKKYAAAWRDSIDLNHASASKDLKRPSIFSELERVAQSRSPAIREPENTTHYSIVDAEGNAVSVTTTLNDSFGSRVTAVGLGFLLNDEMDDFAAKQGVPNAYGLIQGPANAIGPGKRPLSAMTPTIVLKGGKLFLVLGSPGGPRIITIVANILIGVVDFSLDIEEAVNAPRFHHQWLPDEILVEDRLSPDTMSVLRSKGHKLKIDYSWADWGDGECVMIDPKTGERLGASDGRNNGKAVGY
ncbi:MAG TPA: gamma-glutamyltransferase [Terriglobales bacterium]|nr:gamma-glutamyltransferase [Terriglobales bacterium]